MGAAISLIRRHLGITVLLGLGAALRLLFMIAYQPAFWFHGDSGVYIQMARSGLEPHPTRPAGYPALLKLLEPTGTHLAVTAVQHLLGLALALAVYLLLHRRGLPRWLCCLAAAPLLFDSLTLTMGHYLLPDLLFTVLFAGAVVLLLGPGRPGYPAVLGSGLLIAAAWITKPTALPVALLLGLYLLTRRVGWRRLVGYALAFTVPYLGMLFWIDDRPSVYGAQSGIALYGRTAIIADCDRLRLTAAERVACPDQPLGQRWDRADAFFWRRPARLNDVYTEAGAQRLVDFAVEVIRQQPLDYLRVVAKESAAHFVPGLYLGPMNECLRERLVPPVEFRGPERVPDRCPPAQGSADFGGGPDLARHRPDGHRPDQGTAPVRRDPADGAGRAAGRRTAHAGGAGRPPCDDAGAARVSGRVRLDLVLLTLAGPGLTVLTVLVGMYEPRYALPALPLTAIAAALAWHGLTTRPPTTTAGIPGRREPATARARPDAGRSGVVVDHQTVADRAGLAGQHVAGGEFVRLQGVVARHRHLAGHHLRPAGRADPALARVRQLAAHLERGVEHPLVAAHPERRRPAVQHDGHVGAGRRPSWSRRRRRPAARLVDMEQLGVYGVAGTPRAASTSRASVTIPYGPQRNHSSIRSAGTRCPAAGSSRSASTRPESRADSPGSRDSTWIRCSRAG